MRTTFCVQFYCRNCKTNKAGESPIELSLIINGKRCFIQLPIKCKASEFKKLLSSRKSNNIKEYCEQVKDKLNVIQLDMLKNNIPFTAQNLKMYFMNGCVSPNQYTITKLFDDYILLIKPRIDKDLTKEHYYRYVKVKSLMLDYLKQDILVEDITPAIITGFLIYIQGIYQESTVFGIMTRLKTIIRYALDNNKINHNPFQGIKYGRGKKEIKYLTEEELSTIYNLEIHNKTLSQIRDAFILQASTGLSYIDLVNLKKEDIHIDTDGTHYIIKNRHKTNVQFTTVVLPMGIDILKKYDYQLHIISNQKINEGLKHIQKFANIETNLTTHIARKSFATTLLNRGVRMEAVSKMLGHSNLITTSQVYAKLKNKTIIDEVKAVF